MAIEQDLIEIKSMLVEQGELLRRIAGVRVMPEDDKAEFSGTSAARYCGVSYPTLRKYVQQLGIAGHCRGKRGFTYYSKMELDTIIRIKRLDRKKRH
jgi:hypothetical protein